MTTSTRPTPADIRRARADNPKMRERDLALQLGISEAELVGAWCGESVKRIRADANALLLGLEPVGEVMALTRNDSAVHEKIGVYDKVRAGERASVVLSKEIDLRVFPSAWKHGFAVEKSDGETIRRSLQFFDARGDAVHKVHLRPSSDIAAFHKLEEALATDDQSPEVEIAAPAPKVESDSSVVVAADDLRERWTSMTDVHQFSGILRSLKLSRRQALRAIGQDYAWQLDGDCVSAMMHNAANEQIPIMCFVGNKGCIQIHSGPVRNIKPMGPWLNVMDPTFHLHLRTDHIREVWAVRKPNTDGHVTSLEAYGADGELIIQFFGLRKEGRVERDDWRMLAEGLPRQREQTAA